MIKKILILHILVITLVSNLNASPYSYSDSKKSDGWYLSFGGGPSILGVVDSKAKTRFGPSSDIKYKMDLGSSGGIAGGYQWNGFRMEAELFGLFYQGGKGENGGKEFDIGDTFIYGSASMFNVVYDLYLMDSFYIYGGGGLGTLYTLLQDNLGNQDTGISFAYQGLFGVGYDFTPTFGMMWGYRILGATGNKYQLGTTTYDINSILSHSFEVRLRFNF